MLVRLAIKCSAVQIILDVQQLYCEKGQCLQCAHMLTAVLLLFRFLKYIMALETGLL